MSGLFDRDAFIWAATCEVLKGLEEEIKRKNCSEFSFTKRPLISPNHFSIICLPLMTSGLSQLCRMTRGVSGPISHFSLSSAENHDVTIKQRNKREKPFFSLCWFSSSLTRPLCCRLLMSVCVCLSVHSTNVAGPLVRALFKTECVFWIYSVFINIKSLHNFSWRFKWTYTFKCK